MKSVKSWQEKLDNASAPKNPHVVEAPLNWNGGQEGGTMVIPSARELDAIIRQIPDGQTRKISDIRAEYAKSHNVDITCPLTTGIFLRFLAENAESERAHGKKDVTPYWRAVADNGQMPPKLQVVYDRFHDRPLT